MSSKIMDQKYLWTDPFHDARGAVLLSDQIRFLVRQAGMIDNFSEECLRPAAYDLRVGKKYYKDDEPLNIEDHGSFEIPPNGLVYVQILEKLTIPYYLVARYSLRVQQVYRGLLIDNGLHVDPGYHGHIWIPVHNFTTEPRSLTPGQPFLSMEFNRTTALPKAVGQFSSEDDFVASGISNDLKGIGGEPVKIFYRDHSHYEKRDVEFVPPMFWCKFPGEKHRSATLQTEERLGAIKKDVDDRIRKVENVGYFAIILLVVGLLAIILPIWYGRIGELGNAQQAEIDALKVEVRELKGRVEGPSTSPPANAAGIPKSRATAPGK